MSKSIDERVVEMRFDNKQFESNVASTMRTLEKLDNSLKLVDAIDGITNVAKAIGNVSFEGMAKGIDALNQKFSTMGVAGMAVVQRITNALIDSGKQLYNSTIGQIKTGGMNRAMNIEQAKFQLEGLKIAWEDVYDSINDAVAGTAYGLDSAAKASAQLAASNVALGDDMSVALRAISGVAAMTNSSYDEIAHIFTTIAGNGRVMTEQLNQFAGRGLNVAAELAKAFGVTEGELREMVSKGEVDFGRFAKAMNDAFGEHAAEANKTYAGSLSNVKAALSKIGAEFAAPYMDSMGDIFRALIPVLNGVRPLMKPIFDDASEFMHAVATFIAKSLENFNYEPIQNVINLVHQAYLAVKPIGAVLADIGSALVRVWNSFKLPGTKFKEWLQLDKILEKVNDALTPMQKVYKAVGEPFTKTFGVIKGAVDGVLSPIKTVTGAVKGVSTGVKEVGDAIESTTDYAKKIEETAMEVVRGGKFANNIEERRKEIEGLGLSFELVQNRVNEYFGNAYRYEVKQEDLAKMTGEVTDENNKLADSMGNVSALSQKAEVIFRGVGAAISIVAKFAGAVLVGISPLIGVLARAGVAIVNFVSFMGIYVQSLEKAMDRSGWFATITNVVTAAVNALIGILGPPVQLFIDFEQGALRAALSLLMMVANYKELSKTNKNISRAVKSVTIIFTKLRNVFVAISYAVSSFIDKIKKSAAFTRFVDGFKALKNSLKKLGIEVLLKTLEKISTFKFKAPKLDKNGKVYETITRLLDGLAQSFENAKDWVDRFYNSFKEKGFDAFREEFSGLFSIIDRIAELGSKGLSILVDAFDKAKTAVVDFWNRIKNLIGMVKKSDSFRHFTAALGALWRTLKAIGIELFVQAFKSLVDIVSKFKLPKIDKESKAYERITAILDKLTPIIWAANKRLRVFLNDLREKGIVGAFSHALDDLKNSAKGLLSKLAENKYVKVFLYWIKKAKAGLLNFLDGIKIGKNGESVLTYLNAFVVAFKNFKNNFAADPLGMTKRIFNDLKDSLASLKDKIASVFDGITEMDPVTAVKTIFERLKDAISDFDFSSIAETVKEKFTSIFSFGGSKKEESPGGGFLSSLGEGLKAVKNGLNDTVNIAGKGSLVYLIFSIAKMFSGQAKIFKNIAKVIKSFKNIGKNVKGLVDSISGIFKSISSTITAYEKKLKAEKWKERAKTVLILAAALAVLAGSLWLLSQLDEAGLKRGAMGIAVITAALGALLVLMTLLERAKNKGKGAAGPFDSIAKALSGFQDGVNKFLKRAGLSALLIGIAASVAILVKIIDMMSKIDPEKAVVAIPMIIVLMTGLAVAAGIVSKMGKDKGNVGKAAIVLALAISMKKIVEAMKEISKLSTKQLLKGVITLGLIMAELAISVKIIAGAESAGGTLGKIVTLLAIVISVKLLVGTLKSIAEMSLAEILKGVVGLGAIMVALGVLLASVENIQHGKAAVAVLLMVVIDLVAITLAVKSLAEIDKEKLLATTGGLAIIIAAMALLAKSSDTSLKGLVVLGTLTLVVAAIAGLLYLMSGVSTDGMLERAESISLILLAMSAVCGVLAVIGRDSALIPHALNGLLGMLLVVGGIGGVFAALGYYLQQDAGNGQKNYDKLQELLDTGIPLMSKVMKGIGSMIGELAGGFVSGLLDGLGFSLESFATDLSNFMDNLQPFIDKVRTITASDITSVAYLTGIVALMAADDVLTAITNLITLGFGGLPLFALKLNGFAVNSATFFDLLSTVDESTLTSAKYLADSLLALTKADLLSGISNLIGKGGFDNFGTQLDCIGKGIAFFAARTKHIDTDNVENAANAVKILAELNDELPRTGGAIQQFLGEKNMGEFGERMGKLGEGLKKFSDSVTADGGIDTEAIKSSASAALVLAELNNNLPTTGGRLQDWLGEKNLAEFGVRLWRFGVKLKQYSDVITADGGIDSKAVEDSAEAGAALAELNKMLPPTGGALQAFLGEQNLFTFGARLKLFGISLKAYSDIITKDGGIKYAAVTSSANCASSLAVLENALPASGGWWQTVTGSKSLSEFGTQLKDFGTGLKDYSDSIQGVDTERIIEVSGVFSDLIDFANTLAGFSGNLLFLDNAMNAENGINTFLQGFTDVAGDAILRLKEAFTGETAEEDLKNLGSTMMGYIKDGFNSGEKLKAPAKAATNEARLALTGTEEADKWKTTGGTIISYLLSGISGKINTSVKEKMKTLIGEVRDVIVGDPFNTTFKTAGTKLLQYLIAGFNHTRDQVINKIRFVIADGQRTIIGSPYDLTYKAAGSFLMQYVIQGIGTALPTVLNKFRDVATQGQNTLIGSPFDTTFKSAGSIMIYRVVSGVNNAAGSLVTACGNAAQSGVNAFGAYVGSFDVAGWNLIMGAITGMNNASVHIFDAAYYIANTVLSIISAVWDEHSPSKEGESRGSYLIQGVTNGVTKAAAGLYNSVDTLADNTLDVMHNAIQRVSDAIESDIDATPVIRPVVDLTGIEDGANAIDGLLGNGSMSSLNAAIGGIGANVSAQAAAMNATNPEDLVPTFYATVPVYLDGKEIGNRTADIAIQRISRTQLSVMRAAGR